MTVRRVAAVDVGTNTTRLLIADVAANGSLAWVARRVTVTGLGWGLDRTGRIGEEGMAKTVAVLAEYRRELDAHGVEAVGAVATAATREASNRDQFLSRAEVALGHLPEVVSGEEEAALTFAGVLSDVAGDPPYLVIDPGGGSTEFVLGEGDPSYAVSVKMGSVRLTDRCLPDHPASAEQVAAAAAAAREAFAVVELPSPPGTVVGVGGTFTALAAIAADAPEQVHRPVLDAGRLDELVEWLATLTVEETAAIPSLDPARAPVLLGGAVVIREAVRAVGAGSVIVSANDILAGVALRAARN